MRRLQTGEPVWDLHFDEKGRLTAPAQRDFLDEVIAEGVADLFMFSHGWGTSEKSARGLYDAMFPMIGSAANGTAGVGKVGFAGIYWPSLWFPETPATPPKHAGSTQAGSGAVVDLSAGTTAVSGAEIAESLRPGFADQAQQQAVTEIGRLIEEGEAAVGSGESDAAKEQRLLHIHQQLQSLLPPAPGGEFEDSGETALLLTADPKTGYQAAAEAFGSAPPGSSTQGAGDWFGRAINGAKDAVRVLSYTVMKARAGDIGPGRAGTGARNAAQAGASRPGASDWAQLRRPPGLLRPVRHPCARGQPDRIAGARAGRLLALVVRARAGQPVRQPWRPEHLCGPGSRPARGHVHRLRLGCRRVVSEGVLPGPAGHGGRGRGALGRYGRRRVPGREPIGRPGNDGQWRHGLRVHGRHLLPGQCCPGHQQRGRSAVLRRALRHPQACG